MSSSSDTFSISLSDICNNMSSSSNKSLNRYYTTSSTCNSSMSSSSSSVCPPPKPVCNSTSSSSVCPPPKPVCNSTSSSSVCPAPKPDCKSSSSSSVCPAPRPCCDVTETSCGTTTVDTSSVCDASTSASSNCNKCDNATTSTSSTCKANPCVDTCCECKQVVRAYEKNKRCIKANNEAVVILEFIINKFKEAGPVLRGRVMEDFPVLKNIAWVESFIDRVLCVVTQNSVCKAVKVTVCKHKIAADTVGSRVYTLTMHFGGGVPDKVIDLDFNWKNLTLNNNLSFIAVIGFVVKHISLAQVAMKAENASFVFF